MPLAFMLPPNVWLADVAPTSLYGYQPKLAPAGIFVALFGILFIAHSIQLVYYRQWWVLLMPLGALAECGGYIARIYGHTHDRLRDPYVAMEVLLVVTPVLFAAVHFTSIGRVATLFPRRYSIIRPIFVMPLFVTVDVISLVVQAVGSAMAGTSDTADDAQSGSNVVVAGVAVQLFGYLIFDLVFASFWWRVRKDRPPLLQKYESFMLAVFLSSMCVVLRSIYRVAEMAVGWDGVINTTEWCLYSFDGAFVVLAVFILNVYPVGKYLPKKFNWKYNPEVDGDEETRKALWMEGIPDADEEKMASSQPATMDKEPTYGEFYDAVEPNIINATNPTTGSRP